MIRTVGVGAAIDDLAFGLQSIAAGWRQRDTTALLFGIAGVLLGFCLGWG